MRNNGSKFMCLWSRNIMYRKWKKYIYIRSKNSFKDSMKKICDVNKVPL